MKRYYQLETLASATEWMLRTSDRFIVPSVQEVLGPAPLVVLGFELFQEGKYQFIFRLRATNAKGKEGVFAFVVAKKHEDYSALARAEHRNLQVLYDRAPAVIVKPFRGGNIFLPDRHHRAEHGREIYAYLTQWLNGFQEMGVSRDLQFIVNVKAPHTFTIAQTEAIKGRMIEVIARTYDRTRRNGMDMPQVASGDFVVSWPCKGVPRLKLIACRRLLTHLTPANLIHRIAGASWPWGRREFRLAPLDPRVLFEAFVNARGPEEARAWFTQYGVAVAAGKLEEQETLSLEDLKALDCA
jgi:hypothetical protein